MPVSAWQPGLGGVYNVEGRVLFKLLHPGPEGAPPGEGTLRTAASEGPLPVSPPQIRPLI